MIMKYALCRTGQRRAPLRAAGPDAPVSSHNSGPRGSGAVAAPALTQRNLTWLTIKEFRLASGHALVRVFAAEIPGTAAIRRTSPSSSEPATTEARCYPEPLRPPV